MAEARVEWVEPFGRLRTIPIKQQQVKLTGMGSFLPNLLPSFRLYVQFEDGTEGAVDMSKFLARDCGIFKVLRNVETFNAAYVGHGAVTWPNELDLAPDKMHDELQKSDVYVMR